MTVEQPEHLRIRGGRPLRGDVTVPADLEIMQRALLFAALSDGSCELLGVPAAQSCRSMLDALRALGVPCEQHADSISVRGVGLRGLRMPKGALDCGFDWGSVALFAGVLSAQAFGTRITVHPTLALRSVESIVGPLRARGAHIAGRAQGDAISAPIAVAPLLETEHLVGLDATLPCADADAKGAALISGLFAAGETTISEPSVSPDHIERLMVACGLPLRRVGSMVAFDPSGWDRRIPAFGRVRVAGSTTLASYLAIAAQFLPGSDFMLRAVGINPTRSGALDMLGQWSRALHVVPSGDATLREPIADMRVRHAAQRGGAIGGELLARAHAELPGLAMLGHIAQRGVQLYDLNALPSEPATDLAARDAMFGAFGIALERHADELRVMCGGSLRPVQLDAQHDARLSLYACVLGLACPGETMVKHAAQALGAVYPGLIETARALGADIELL